MFYFLSVDFVLYVFFCRFDECGLSPLTVKALIAAGYVQMTRVQEATLSVCLEGMQIVFYVSSPVMRVLVII